MWLAVRPASVGIVLEVQTPENGDAPKRKEHISLQVLPTDEANHLDLDTGEVFQDYNYARILNKHESLIGARLTIEPASAESDYKRNSMRYMEGVEGKFDSFPATIFFTMYVEPTIYLELAQNVRNGLLPETITIDFERSSFFANPKTDAALGYGWEPDGSGMVWHNKESENRLIRVESIKFDYAVLKPRHDGTTHQLLPMIDLPPVRINEQLASIQLMLVEVSKHVRWAAIGIIVLALIVAFWMVGHL